MRRPWAIRRDEHGIPHVEAETEADLFQAMGRVHAADRGLQMLLMRIAGQGRIAEILDPGDASLEVDRFFRRMNWAGKTEGEAEKLTPRARAVCESYCEGVNAVLARRVPWELRLLGCKPEPWTVKDILLLFRVVGYITLAQSQGEMERLIVEMVQAGISGEKLEELFPGRLDGLDQELVRKVRLGRRMVPAEIAWRAKVPALMASNNWVVAGSRTASGKPMLSNDPHLEVNRVPSVWCEIVLKRQGRYAMGGSMPGLPGVVVGRTSDLAWGATYAFLDAEDSWVERCKEGRYLREGDGWVPFQVRKERIRRKGKEAVEATFYENEHGVLDGDPNEQGFYLATRWAASEAGARSMNGLAEIWDCGTVEQGMDLLGQIEAAFSFVLADRYGNIGFQMSGLCPVRKADASGLVPLPGWKKENDWQGFVGHRDLPRCLNPEQGFLVTANQDLNRYGRVEPINLPMGSYRADRIGRLLAQEDRLDPEAMFRIQTDLYSPQAASFMKILGPLLPDTAQGRILRDWDFRYNADSRGAFLFEEVYRALGREVFGRNGLGESATEYIERETGLFSDFYANFDRVLLAERSAWFEGQTRAELYRRAAEEALAVEPRPWGETRRVPLSHILFGGKLPGWLGFDRGPVTIIGGRATIHQGQIFRSGGRTTTFCPSFRMVADLSHDEMRTSLAGGPSDRRFSKWYCSDLKNWQAARPKTVRPDGARNKFP
ncbi:MAG: penicillin acylase family protein [bacterium]